MNAQIGWALAVAAIAIGYLQYGWKGVVLALSMIMFWLLLQFSRALRAMRAASSAPVGHVASAVMLQAKLKTGMRLIDLIQLSRSLGEKLGDEPERYRWSDASGASVTVVLHKGKLDSWQFERVLSDETGAEPAGPAAPGT